MRGTTLSWLALTLSLATAAQAAGQIAPRFEVASVKPNASSETLSRWGIGTPGVLGITNGDLFTIIAQAYGIDRRMQRFLFVGGPQKLLADRFDITAKVPEDATLEQTLSMFRALLADRFLLRTHLETRQVPSYVLAVFRDGKLGPDLHRVDRDCEVLRKRGINWISDPDAPKHSDGGALCVSNTNLQSGSVELREAGSIALLVSRMQAFLDQPLVDGTRLEGSFEWSIAFVQDPQGSADSDVTDLPTALRDRLGLKIERRLMPFEVRVIDSVERPTPD
jgi:uncharacterized protein (TIGR03435 family)